MPYGIPLFAKGKVDSEGRLLAITDEERQARWALRRAALEAAWGITEEESDSEEIWDEVMRNLGMDPVTGRGLGS